ncbi:MAG: DNA-directed RNA polymerase subunit beta, partial [Selenomonadaceae bacterium]|nr:DNA-directed RNA polymerase subunit beta [Selenomonadaceae bacterium]
MLNPVKVGKRTRYSYARIKEVMSMPHLLDIQRNSYDWFKKEGLAEIFKDVSPISDFTGNLELFFESFTFGECKYSLEECKKRDGTFAAPIRVKVKLQNKEKGFIKEQEVFMGDFPIMTETGTFIINGAERVIDSQIIRSPGAYYDGTIDQSGKNIFSAHVIPNRGAWIELETDSQGAISARIDRTRKMPVTYLLRSLDFTQNDDIIDLFDIAYFVSQRLEIINEKGQLEDADLDLRDSLLKAYLMHPNRSDETFKNLLDAFEQLDEKFDRLANLRYLLDKIISADEKNHLAIAYKVLLDQLDVDKKSNEDNKEKALLGVYNRLRPGEPPSADNALGMINSLFFDPRRYDLAQVGRYKITKKLGWRKRILGKTLAREVFDPITGELLLPADVTITQDLIDKIPVELEERIFNLKRDDIHRGFFNPISLRIRSRDGDFAMLCVPDTDCRTVSLADITSAVGYIFELFAKTGITDDIDHLGNRRVRAVGELLQNQFRIGMSRMERVIRERMTTQDSEIVTPQNLINIRPVVAAIKEFFGSSQLSQFMDQHNPLSELTHKRRLSALGPGGLSRERAGFEVRDVHNSHYGRMCPIETPEGPNIGLIGSLSNFARVNQYGFMETPYRSVDKINRQVTSQVRYLSADEEEALIIAQANEPLDQNDWFVNEYVTARVREETTKVRRESVDFMDVSPKQVVSIATALIPFLENDDANRALMGANMQRQAVPLLKTQPPLVGTGMEFKAACDSGVMILAQKAGTVSMADSNSITIETADKSKQSYYLTKFSRSNQGTCINQI